MWVHTYVCALMYVCMYVRTTTLLLVGTYICALMYVCMYVRTTTLLLVGTYICAVMYVCVYALVYYSGTSIKGLSQ